MSLNNEKGFTVIELAMVVVLIAVITSVLLTRFDAVSAYKQKGEIRQFANVWQFLYEESKRRGEDYRLNIDLENNQYWVDWEIPIERSNSRDVDLLSGLRTKGEQERRKQEEAERTQANLEQEFAAYDVSQGGDLETQFFKQAFKDPFADVRLAAPIHFPSLGKKKTFEEGVMFKDVKTSEDRIVEGKAIIRFSAAGAASFAVVHLQTPDESVYTIYMNPSTGSLKTFYEDVDFEWTLKEKR